jgi:PKD repeat protein
MRYVVRVGGVFVGSTTATSITVPVRVSKGSRSWSVTAADPAGHQGPTAGGKVLIDTTPPRVSFTSTTSGHTVTVSLQYTDHWPGVRYSSGVGSVVVKWGDGKSSTVPAGQPRRSHVYARPGRYRVTVIVTDRAKNQTRRAEQVTIA